MSKARYHDGENHKGSFFHVEGLDLAILKGLALNKCLPSVIHHRGLGQRDQSSFNGLLEPQGYKLSSVANITLFLVRQD
jgi:hypothetical protein